jgi:hypothetical protein
MIRNALRALTVALTALVASAACADAPKEVLLLGAKRDHPKGRHQYMAGLRVLAKCLEGVPGVKTQVIAADEPWPQGPELLKKADGVVLYLGEGAKWIQASPQRLSAIQDLARRRGGIVALHWAAGAQDAKYIEPFRGLVGGCHGGPDRRYVVMEGDLRVADRGHPITQGVTDLRVKDEFYFRLKFAKQGKLQPILQVPIEGNLETVAWAYERPDGGRSFGFSGADPHENWRQVAYRRLAAQAVLWTLKLPVPPGGLAVRVSADDLTVPASE